MDRLRAIDALIAQHLMGVPPTGCGLEFWRIYKQNAFTGEWHPIAFSSDPAASKQARDKMRELGWTVSVEGWKSFDHDEFCVSLRAYEDQAWWYQKDVRGEDEELAVALAILAALGVEVPE